ncbi:hypothetical protein GA0074692_2261 [Micromonospora pallida]|uniref:Uncharacterized protein n=1 Tax=Micromonospora pallida TaxID=145854 RepID=A0A1C6SBW8_9ACTN|nr:hypothetical protein [Micromonospora pallida]SCL26946.1 hypothetical protein GA0074692_2261 [Micromonospora pallida]
MIATPLTPGRRGRIAPPRRGSAATPATFQGVFYTRRSIDLMRVCSSVCR